MRIALVNNFFRPRAGGSAHFTEELAKQLAVRGHDVIVVTSSIGSSPGETVEDGYTVFRLPAMKLPPLRIAFNYELNITASPVNLVRLTRRLQAFQPDVIHLNNQVFDLSLQAELVAAFRRVPVVATIHTALVHSSRALGAVLSAIDHTVVRGMFKASNAWIVAPDRTMDTYTRERYGRPANRIVNIPIGIDVRRFDGEKPAYDARERHGVGDRPLVLSIGHVIPMIRDRLALVEALPRLRELVPNVVVMIVGHVYDDAFLRRARELGVDGCIMTVGSKPKADIPAYVAAADVEAHELDGWGMGTATMEVMAAGVPVVAVVREDNFPGIPMRDGESVLIVAKGDSAALAGKLAKLLTDREFRAVSGRAQAQFVRTHFSIEVVTDQYICLYETMAGHAASDT
jgi:1,2-diacylglycerol 3-alpha-glucosyltransferase